MGKRASLWLAAGIVLPWLGCGSGNAPTVEAPSETEVEQARAIYEDQSCGVCHGETADGGEIGPALRDLTPYWNVERVMAYLRDPDGFRAANPDFDERRDRVNDVEMPAYDMLSDEDARVLARWLLSR